MVVGHEMALVRVMVAMLCEDYSGAWWMGGGFLFFFLLKMELLRDNRGGGIGSCWREGEGARGGGEREVGGGGEKFKKGVGRRGSSCRE